TRTARPSLFLRGAALSSLRPCPALCTWPRSHWHVGLSGPPARALGLCDPSLSTVRHLHLPLDARQARLRGTETGRQAGRCLSSAESPRELRGRGGFQQCKAAGGFCAGAVKADVMGLGNFARCSGPSRFQSTRKVRPLLSTPL
ncbi:unnamed protein product, partial [Gulo gulo]